MTTKALQAQDVLKNLHNKVVNGQLELPISGLDNIRNNRGRTPEKDFLTLLKENKKQGDFIASKFSNIAKKSEGTMKDVFDRTALKLYNCSTYGAFREVSDGQIHKIGQALCKNKFCPVCQRVLAYKRRMKAEEFFEENKDKLATHNFYHLVLTLRHNKNHRNYDYVDELLAGFKNLRGTNSKKGDYQKWKLYIDGGYYSVEVKQGQDSPHIHIHALLLTKKDVKTKELGFIAENWKTITGDSTQIQLEPIFFLQEKYEKGATEYKRKDGSMVWKMTYDPAIHGMDHLKSAFMESLKYTIKTDDILGSMNGEMDDSQRDLLYSLLTKRHRLYSRFGCLTNTKKNRENYKGLEKLSLNFKDLEDLNATNYTLVDIETGEQKLPSETVIFVTKFSNVRVKTKTKEYTLYKFINEDKIAPFRGDDTKGVQSKLSRSLKEKKIE